MSVEIKFQELCELAEKEVVLGLTDERLMEQAMVEAKGVAAHARQIYWRMRATELQGEMVRTGSAAQILQLNEELGEQERRLRARKERYRWIWALACFAGIAGTFVFSRLAITAYARGSAWFYVCAFLGAAFLVLIVLAYTASQHHTHTD